MKEQIVSKQKEDVYVPQANQNTEKHVVQKKDTVPKYVDIPPMTGIQFPFYPDPLMTPPLRNFEENSLYQEGIISEIYQRPDKSQLVQPSEINRFGQYQ